MVTGKEQEWFTSGHAGGSGHNDSLQMKFNTAELLQYALVKTKSHLVFLLLSQIKNIFKEKEHI